MWPPLLSGKEGDNMCHIIRVVVIIVVESTVSSYLVSVVSSMDLVRTYSQADVVWVIFWNP